MTPLDFSLITTRFPVGVNNKRPAVVLGREPAAGARGARAALRQPTARARARARRGPAPDAAAGGSEECEGEDR